MPDAVAEGARRINVTNAGEEPHHAQVLRLADNATSADLRAALASGGPPAAAEVGTFLGGTALVDPRDGASRADAIVDLEPGEPVMLCFVPDSAGEPHVAHGMVRPFEVTASTDPAPPRSEERRVGKDCDRRGRARW